MYSTSGAQRLFDHPVVMVSAEWQPFYELLSSKIIKLGFVCGVHRFSSGQDGVRAPAEPSSHRRHIGCS
jgi:hypothetical protein